MSRVIGVFDTDSDLELALNRLMDKGINEVRVIDRAREAENTGTSLPAGAFAPAAAASNTGTSQPNSVFPIPFLVPGFFGLGDETITGAYFNETLGYADIGEDEADFYANVLRKGGKVLIVETDDDRTDEIWSVMRNSNASQFSRAE